MKLWDHITTLLFPPKCVLCASLLSREETDLCGACRRETEEYKNGKAKISFVARCFVLWYYKGNVRKSLLRYKFRGRRSYANTYARLLAMKLSREEANFDLITWVPVSPARKRSRGFDQVELIAAALAAELEKPTLCTLKKIRNNKTQSTIAGSAERRANVLGAYQPLHTQQFRGKRVLLLDDIITTGATVSECARVLLTAGAAEVLCGAVAGAPHQQDKNSR